MENFIVVIPCFNEEYRLPINEYHLFLANYDVKILFINDGSTDNTAKVLSCICEIHHNKAFLVNLNRNFGKAEAVRIGVNYVISAFSAEFIGYMDADLATPLNEMYNLLTTIKKYDFEVAFGSRMSRIGAKITRNPARHYIGRFFATIISAYLGIPIYDSQCGAKVFRRRIANDIFARPFISRWLFDVEIFKRILILGYDVEKSCYEQPLLAWTEKGNSKIKLVDFFRMPLDFAKIVNSYANENNQFNYLALYGD